MTREIFITNQNCAMLKYQSWQTKQGRFLSMTGITVEEFNNLVPHFVEAHDDYFSKYSLDGKARKVRVKATIYSKGVTVF